MFMSLCMYDLIYIHMRACVFALSLLYAYEFMLCQSTHTSVEMIFTDLMQWLGFITRASTRKEAYNAYLHALVRGRVMYEWVNIDVV